MPLDEDTAKKETAEYQRAAIGSLSAMIFRTVEENFHRDGNHPMRFTGAPRTINIDGIDYTARATITTSEVERSQEATASMSIRLRRIQHGISDGYDVSFDVDITGLLRNEDGESLEEVYQRLHHEHSPDYDSPSESGADASRGRSRPS